MALAKARLLEGRDGCGERQRPAASLAGARPAPRLPVSRPLAESPHPVTTRVKQQFWPSVPDPANSSLGKWVPAELQQVRAGWLHPAVPRSPPRHRSAWRARHPGREVMLGWGAGVQGASLPRCWEEGGRGGAAPCKQAVTPCHFSRSLCSSPA